MTLDEAFDRIAMEFPGYTPRSGQLEYSRAVEQTLATNGRLIVEGPCGTGKSIGYLVPAILSGKKVLIVTEGIALQDQLIDKDLPLLARALGSFKFAAMKGRTNYLCLREHARMESQLAIEGSSVEEGAIATWGRMTTTGDRKELAVPPKGAAWAKFSVTTEDCLGQDCNHAAACFALKAGVAARSAQVVVTNYQMLYLAARVREETGGNVEILPEYEVLILDEAHAAAAIARDKFGFDLTGLAVRRIAKSVGDLERGSKVAERLQGSAADFFSELLGFIRYTKRADPKRRITKPDVAKWSGLFAAMNEAANLFDTEAGQLAGLENHASAKSYRNQARNCRRHAAHLREAMTFEFTEPSVYYAEEFKGQASLHGRVIDVSARIARSVFDRASSVIVTSATLASVPGDFSLVASELGLGLNGVDYSTLAVESPFDMSAQRALVIPENVPDPKHPEYRQAADEAIREVVRHAKGRTLVLCTSNVRVKDAASALSECGHRVLQQEEMPVAALVNEFRDDKSSVLVGTMSLWKGVDVSGEALSVVVIDKIPFEAWGDPLVEALREYAGDKGWKQYMARAMVQFRQGIGRLIRSETDRGVVVLLDGRLMGVGKKPYAREFIRCVMPCRLMSRELSYVAEFLESA
jgi:ATP-dependent DNA helicase DinG